jgi:hypothetical protein
MTRETRTIIDLGDIKTVEIECTKCGNRLVRPAGAIWPQNIISCPGGCGAAWMPYRDSLNALRDAIFQLKNFSTLLPSQGNGPPFIVRLEISGDEKL